MRASEALRAPAKLNLTLEVLSRRADGLHGLRSIMVPIDLCDEISIGRALGESAFSCDVPGLQENNLVERAFAALALPGASFDIRLRKRIPTGAGMGGGSSDAAAILLAAQRGAFGTPPRVDYLAVARSLGSDVPFFLVETAALVEGTGERVTALGPVPQWHAVIVKPPVSVSTAWAYGQIDARPRESRARSSSVSVRMAQALQEADFERVVGLLENDFHDVMIDRVPEIGRACAMLERAGAHRPLMTGSGSCVFALAQTQNEAAAIATRFAGDAGYELLTAAFWNGPAWRSAA